jgi:hypothetical protein
MHCEKPRRQLRGAMLRANPQLTVAAGLRRVSTSLRGRKHAVWFRAYATIKTMALTQLPRRAETAALSMPMVDGRRTC